MFTSAQIKKLQIFLLLAIISCVVMISCTSSSNPPQFFPVQVSGKIGFIDNKGKLVIDAKFEAIDGIPTFSQEGLAAVKSNSKCGYIDTDGKTVISFQYDSCKQFSEGLALVGEAIETSKQENGRNILYKESRCNYIDKSGSKLVDLKKNGFGCDSGRFSDGLSKFEMNGKIGFMDKSGTMVIQPQFYDIPLPNINDRDRSIFSEGLALVLIRSETDPSDQKLGYIDKTGKVIISDKFATASSFSEGLAVVSYQEDRKIGGGKTGYIDTTGKIVIEPKFEISSPFSDGLAVFVVGKKAGYIDKTGKIVINPIYDAAFSFWEGLAAVKVNDKFGFIDKTGRIVIEPIYQRIYSLHKGISSFYNGLALVEDKDSKYGYIDKSGKYVWKPTK